MKNITLALPFLFLMSACDQLKVENQIHDKEVELQMLKNENHDLNQTVTDLNAMVASLSVKHPDGAVLVEMRKGLLQREREIDLRESRLKQSLERLELAKRRIARMEASFTRTQEEKLIAIGEAGQIKQEYALAQEKLIQAENRLNHWMTVIFLTGAVFVGGVMWFILARVQHTSSEAELRKVAVLNSTGLLSQRQEY